MSPKNKAHNTVPTLFALSGLIGPHFTRIRSFRSDTFAPADAVANVVGTNVSCNRVKRRKDIRVKRKNKRRARCHWFDFRTSSPKIKARWRIRLQLTPRPTLISRLWLLLRPSLHSRSLIPLRHICARQCGRKRRRPETLAAILNARKIRLLSFFVESSKIFLIEYFKVMEL